MHGPIIHLLYATTYTLTPNPLTHISLCPCCFRPAPPPCITGEEEEKALAEAAADADKPPSPYMLRAQNNGYTPTPDTGDVDPSILDKPAHGLDNIEAVRKHIVGFLESNPKAQSLPKETADQFREYAAALYKSCQLEELNGRANRCRRGVRDTLTRLTKYDPNKQEPIVIADSPSKVELAGNRLAEDYLPAKAYIESIVAHLEDGLNRLTAAVKDAGGDRTNEPSTPSSQSSPDQILRDLVRKSSKARGIKTPAEFGLYAAITLDKLAACHEVAMAKGDYATACHLLQKSQALEKKIKSFIQVAEGIGLSEARKLFSAIGTPFSNMKEEQWEMLATMAADREFRKALEKLGSSLPASRVKPAKRPRDDSEDESDADTPQGKQKRSRRPYCTYCRRAGHDTRDCYSKPKASKGKNKKGSD